MFCVFYLFVWTLVASRVLVLAQDLTIEPVGGNLTIGLDMPQTILCHGTVTAVYSELKWTGPQNATYITNNSTTNLPDGRAIIESDLIFKSFRREDAGTYTCSYGSSPTNTKETKIQLIAGCPYGLYGKNCTKCSQYCVTPTDPLVSPCDLINGTCVDGCKEGYIGHKCEQSIEDITTTTTANTIIDNDNVITNNNDSDEGTKVGIGLGVVFSVIVAIITLIIGLRCCRKKRLFCWKPRTTSKNETNKDNEANEETGEDVPLNAHESRDVGEGANDTDPREVIVRVDGTVSTDPPHPTQGPAVPPRQPQTQPVVTQENSSQVVDCIRYNFRMKIDPLSVLQCFHDHDTNVLTEQDIEQVTAETNNRGKKLGADKLLSLLSHYDGWYQCLQNVLRSVKLGHVADLLNQDICDKLGH